MSSRLHAGAACLLDKPGAAAHAEDRDAGISKNQASHDFASMRPCSHSGLKEGGCRRDDAHAGCPPQRLEDTIAAAGEQPSISLSGSEKDVAEDSDYCQGEAESDASLSDLSDDDNFLRHGRWGR